MQGSLMTFVRSLKKEHHEEIRNVLQRIWNKAPNIGPDSSGVIRRNFYLLGRRRRRRRQQTKAFREMSSVNEIAEFGESVRGVFRIRLDGRIVEDVEATDDASRDIDGKGVESPPCVSARGRVDDAAVPFVDVGKEPFGENVRAKVVDLEDLVETLASKNALGESHTGVVNEEVDGLNVRRSVVVAVVATVDPLQLASSLDDFRSDLRDRVQLLEIQTDADERRFRILRLDFRHSRFAELLRFHVNHDDVRAELREASCRFPADVSVGAGDDGDAAGEGAIGELPLLEDRGGGGAFGEESGDRALGDVAKKSDEEDEDGDGDDWLSEYQFGEVADVNEPTDGEGGCSDDSAFSVLVVKHHFFFERERGNIYIHIYRE